MLVGATQLGEKGWVHTVGIGDVSHHAVAHVGCPLRLSRLHPRPAILGAGKRLVAGFDQSPESVTARAC